MCHSCSPDCHARELCDLAEERKEARAKKRIAVTGCAAANACQAGNCADCPGHNSDDEE